MFPVQLRHLSLSLHNFIFWWVCWQEGDLKRGDGVVFDAGAPERDEEGGTIYDIRSAKGRAKSKDALAVLTFGPGQIDFKNINVRPLNHL